MSKVFIATCAAIIAFASPPAAERVELHVMAHEKGIMKMREVKSFEAPARKRLFLRPGGSHLMIVGLGKPFVKGERIPLMLRFERGGRFKSSSRCRLAIQKKRTIKWAAAFR